MNDEPAGSTGFIVHPADCEIEAWDDPVRGRVQWHTLVSADRTPSHSLTCGLAILPPGPCDTVNVHQHSAAEIYHIVEGEGLLSLAGELHRVRAGSTVFVPGNVVHGLANADAAPLRLFYVFAVDSFDEVAYVFPNDIPVP